MGWTDMDPSESCKYSVSGRVLPFVFSPFYMMTYLYDINDTNDGWSKMTYTGNFSMYAILLLQSSVPFTWHKYCIIQSFCKIYWNQYPSNPLENRLLSGLMTCKIVNVIKRVKKFKKLHYWGFTILRLFIKYTLRYRWTD